jgi:NAD(P)-dependent dehydrogenase (short-subunit alcohol dehydrogenase family)
VSTWLITGASRGFGLAIAIEALARGDQVVATARSAQRVRDAIPDGGDRLLAVEADVTNRSAVDAAVAAAVDRFGRIDVLVNNAGHGMHGAIEESSEANYRPMFEANVFGLLHATQAVLPVMRAQGSGRIINLSSVGGVDVLPGFGLYSATKFAVEAITAALIVELAPFGIDAIALEPAAFRTSFFDVANLVIERNRIADYDRTPVASTRARAEADPRDQPGDPAALARIVVDLGHAATVPPRLALGSNAVERIERRLQSMLADLDEWRAVSLSTDLEH